ncbi:MAG TPA: hypothetical protein DCE23_07780 [Firmicutes bacterium]|nr:hypothetical protein [Bacillota bacterium]
MKRKNKTINVSIFILVVLVLSFFAAIIKLAYISLSKNVDGVDLKAWANNRNTEQVTLKSTRGSIITSDGEVLAQSVNSYTVIAYLSSSRTKDMKNPKHVIDKEMTARSLSPILGMPEEYILTLLNKDAYQVELGPNGRNISTILKNQIEALGLPGIDFIESSKRFYPMSNFAAYTVGYARTNDEQKIQGFMGIEAYFDNELQGKDGYTIYQKDAYGYTIPNTVTITEEPQNGQDVYLTIDSKIQLFVENGIQELSRNHNLDWLTFSVMDAKTGAIVASASNPTFNPNDLGGIKSYLNPLTSYTYEPGSTMKIYSFLAAMEAGVYKGDDTYQSGTIKVDDSTIKDHNNKGWGVITYDSGFAYSSNTAATNLSFAVGREKLYNFYSSLGFGRKTGITLPGEVGGDIDFTYRTEVATASFGQGITTTPIQNLQALTILTNDGIEIQPYIVDRIVDRDTGEVTFQHERKELGKKISEESRTKMLSLMYDVVYSGKTDAKFYKTDSVTVIGKTGTAQIADSTGKYMSGKNDYVRSFAGIFPYEDPQYIIYVSVKRYDGPYKEYAAMVTKIIEEIAKYKNITELVEKVDNNKIITLDNYISTDTIGAEERLRLLNLNVIKLGNGKNVINQYPTKNQVVLAGTKVFLLTSDSAYVMPNIVGWSSSEVNIFAKLLGIRLKSTGYGKVKTQSIPEGSPISSLSVLEVEFE